MAPRQAYCCCATNSRFVFVGSCGHMFLLDFAFSIDDVAAFACFVSTIQAIGHKFDVGL